MIDPLHQPQHHHSLSHQPDNLPASNTQSEGKNGVLYNCILNPNSQLTVYWIHVNYRQGSNTHVT